MKKEDITGIIVYLIIIVLAVVFGLTVLQTHSRESTLDGFPYVMYIIGSVLSGTLFNSILFEVAHILGAKAGKYDIISVNILGLCFYKNEQGKTKIKFASFDGLTGETRIVPKKDMVDKANPYPYLFFGSLFFLVEAIAIMVVFTVLRNSQDFGLRDLAYGLLTFGAIGFVVLLYNILPMRVDAMTDGYRLTMVSNPKNKEAFNDLLRVEHEI